MTRRNSLLLVLAAALPGCRKKPPAKYYDMEGVVKALDPAAQIATIDAGKIGDWMEAMTMEYTVKPDSDFAKLRVGAHIRAKVAVTDDNYYLTDVTVE